MGGSQNHVRPIIDQRIGKCSESSGSSDKPENSGSSDDNNCEGGVISVSKIKPPIIKKTTKQKTPVSNSPSTNDLLMCEN